MGAKLTIGCTQHLGVAFFPFCPLLHNEEAKTCKISTKHGKNSETQKKQKQNMGKPKSKTWDKNSETTIF